MLVISMSSNLNNFPFVLMPSAKDYLWGGERLKEEYNKKMDAFPLAETWECSTHPDGPSYVKTGIHKGKTLAEVIKNNPEYLGTHPNFNGELPILIKFIDAKEDLSIQVHPSDEYARQYENGQLGKTEMWYVLDCDDDAKLIHGFITDVTPSLISDAINNNKLMKYLNKVKVNKGDVFNIESGTVHAIGKGILVAEIQENSNLTYRLYDYNRRDKNGKLRDLHIDKALRVMNCKSSSNIVQKMKVLKYKKGYSYELLERCKYFEVSREIITNHSFTTDSNSFHVLLCLDGQADMIYGDCKDEIKKGDCIFVPANSTEINIVGKIELLNVNC